MSDLSGSTPLTQRLVKAAWVGMKDSPYSNWSYSELPPAAKARVDETVIAMLLDLAEGLTKSGRPSITVAGLLELADSIERGE